MRKSFLLISLLVLVFASCGKKEFEIQGTLIGVPEDKQVIYLLADMFGDDVKPFDTIPVVDGKFSVKGIADGKVLFVQVGDEFYAPLPVVKEEGIIKFLFDLDKGQISITGTKSNDANKAYNDSVKVLFLEFQKANEEYKNSENFKEIKQKKLAKLESCIAGEIEKNAGNQMGEFLFQNDNFYLSSAKKLELLKLFSDDFRNKKGVEKVKKAAEGDLATAVGNKFSDFTGENINGEKTSLSDFAGKGKITVVDFWASWCGPCLRAMPEMKELYEAYKGKGVEVLGVSFDEDKKAWQNAIQTHSLPWVHMVDTVGFDGAGAKYGVQGIPYLMLLDGEGKIVTKGNISVEEVKKEIDNLLK